MPKPVENALYYGDNLDVLRRYLKDESVDLIYLDPPFNSNQDYNVLFAEKSGVGSAAQIKAFEDTWHWDQGAALAYQQTVEVGGKVSQVMQAFRQFLGENDMLAYLTMMAPRLVELRRVLKSTGAIYLHCDTTASHYLKMLMDAVFGLTNFENEISWRRTTTKGDYRQGALNWPRVRDSLLYYRKDAKQKGTFIQQFSPYSKEYIAGKYNHTDSAGRAYMLDNLTAPGAGSRGHPTYEFMGVTRYWRYNKEKMESLLVQGRVIQPSPGAVPRYKRYLDEMPGVAFGDSWDDIPPINSQAQERLGYPTQKPEALLERIINASSNEGEIVLDPFCGCGTAIAAAQKLKRHWIGIDITHLAITLIKHRLHSTFGKKVHYKVIGEPVDLTGAKELAEQDPYQFQWWALGLVGARPAEQKKGADQGIDGRLYFFDEHMGSGRSGTTKQIIFSVKAGHLTVSHVRDLWGVVEREKAQIGVLISMEEPTKAMRTEVAKAGFYEPPFGGKEKHYPRLQLLTITELLQGKEVSYPAFKANVTFKAAPKAKEDNEEDSEGTNAPLLF
jgi:site-specific DNA-methyltransferase (adenine-specific)